VGRRTKKNAKPSRAREFLTVVFVVGLAVAVLAGLAVLPAKTWFSQKEKMEEAEAEVARIEAETAELELELQLLATDEEIELRARRDFDLVYPGEESYRIVTEEP
jgi:cell division protein FtsB